MPQLLIFLLCIVATCCFTAGSVLKEQSIEKSIQYLDLTDNLNNLYDENFFKFNKYKKTKGKNSMKIILFIKIKPPLVLIFFH